MTDRLLSGSEQIDFVLLFNELLGAFYGLTKSVFSGGSAIVDDPPSGRCFSTNTR